MAYEIKTMDIANEEEAVTIECMQRFGWKLKSSQRIYNQDSRPVGAISYEGLTYVHSQTNTVDFTKSVFERDKKMPFYEELVALEEEFFDLLEESENERPHDPGKLLEYDDWVRKYNPSPMSSKAKFITALIISTIASVLIYVLAGGSRDGILYYFYAIPALFLPSYILALIINPFMRPFAVEGGLITERFKRLYSEYVAEHIKQIAKIEFFDHATKRIPQILEEAQLLID